MASTSKELTLVSGTLDSIGLSRNLMLYLDYQFLLLIDWDIQSCQN